MATLTADQVYAAARGAGATHDEAVILTAIARGESGWRTDAHNPNAGTGDNSYGLWQINMLGSMGDSRRQQFGISSNEMLFDPRVNARAAVAILRGQGLKAWSVYTKGIYKQYLPEAQAAGEKWKNDWQSPAMSLNQAFPASDVGEVIGGPAGGDGSGGGGGGGAPGGAALPANASPAQIEAYIRENFPQAAGFLDIPEIRKVLIDAARNQWTETKLQAELQATTWWRTNSSSVRQYFALKGSDPAQLKALIDQKIAEMAPQFAQLGIKADQHRWAEQAIKFGWTPEQLRDKFAAELSKMSGQSGLKDQSAPDITADQLMVIARNEYFVPISRQDAEKWAIDIFSGRKTEDSVRDYFATMAEARFPGIKSTGFTPGEYMAPVRNIIAETLELNPGEVDLLDRRFADVLQTQGGDGKLRPMSLAEAERWARSQTEYRYTSGAQKEAASMTESLLRTFGAVG